MAKAKKKKIKKQIKSNKSLRNNKNNSVVKNSKKKKPVSNKKKQVKNGRESVKREKNGRIMAGSGGNGGGRPKGSLSGARLSELRQSISAVELRLKFNWLEEQIIKSREDTTLAVAILARLYPSLKSIEQITVATDSMEDEEAKQIRNEMLERFRG